VGNKNKRTGRKLGTKRNQNQNRKKQVCNEHLKEVCGRGIEAEDSSHKRGDFAANIRIVERD